MTCQDETGMLWYGVPGVAFNSTDPTEVMLNVGTTAPLLSDHPRSIIASHIPQPQTITTYSDHGTISHHSQMLYDHSAGDYVSPTDYIYEPYENYEEEDLDVATVNALMQPHNTELLINKALIAENKPKKPKVHQHPALKLKTPIAYQKDTDINAIPIMKEGMAVCEKCGAIGVRHAFYGKERKFCSLLCARPPNQMLTSLFKDDAVKTQRKKWSDGDFADNDNDPESENVMIASEDAATFSKFSNYESDVKNESSVAESFENQDGNSNDLNLSSEKSSALLIDEFSRMATLPYDRNSYEWELAYLDMPNFVAADVHSFKHAPMAECWEQINTGMKVEVSCKDESLLQDSFWVATVISIAGYKTKLRYEGFIEDNSKDFWVDLCSDEVHPVGWCATQGKPLIPPKSIQHKYRDWKEFLLRRLTGARTLPTNFHSKVVENKKSRLRPGLNLEVVDKNRIAQMRVATVTDVVGKRLLLTYHGAPPDDSGFWCHEDSPLIHPVGWSRDVGHEIVASQSYHEKCIDATYEPDDAGPDLFVTPRRFGTKKNSGFTKGMKLEAVDPLNLATICVATVMKVLRYNYLMIRIDSYDKDATNSDWFCYHASSPSIFPAGFCELNDIHLSPPRGYEGEFSWYTYLKNMQAVAAPPSLFEKETPHHGFTVGMHLEAVDLMDPRLICVAAVKAVKGQLLKIQFDGWEDDFDQWVDCQCPDIYPVGWCKMVSYPLEGPRMSVSFIHKRRLKGYKNLQKEKLPTRKSPNKDTENTSPFYSPSTNSPGRRKRGRKPRLRGLGRIVTLGPQLYQDTKNLGVSHDNGLYGSAKGLRGRPRKDPLKISNHDTYQQQQQQQPTYLQSDNEDSDDSSSGVPSLVDDLWDAEDKTRSTKVSSQLIPDVGCKDSVEFHDIPDTGSPLDTLFPSGEGGVQSLPSFDTTDVFSVSEENFLSQPKATNASGIASTGFEDTEDVFIPRIIDNGSIPKGRKLQPSRWSEDNVATFLRVNDCGSYCSSFILEGIDGTRLLRLSQNEVMELTGMKVGPSLKIHNLIQQLLAIVNPAQARYQATLLKRGIAFGKS